MHNNVVEARNLRKTFGDFVAVGGVSFTIRQGECFGLLGPNGAGKSSLIRVLYGSSPRSGGELTVFGLDPQKESREIKKQLGIVTQENALDESMSVYENMALYASFYKIPDKKKRIDELLELLSLSHKANSTIQALSGGMKRRLVFVRALLNRPRFLILDEPTTGLDPAVRQLLWDKVKNLRAQGTTILLTTHYMDEAEYLCDRLLVLDKGQIKEEGSPRSLIEKHCSGYVALAAHGRIEGTSIDALLKILQGKNIKPDVIRPSNLEDVFIHLTGREITGDA